MSRNLGTLTVDMVAKTAGFVQGMDKAGRSTKQWKTQVESDLKTVDKVARISLAAIAGAAVAAGTALAGMTKKGIETAANQNALARALDTSYDSLTALNLAFGDSGIDGFEASMNRLNRRLGAAELGRGAALKTVQELGLNLKELANVNADQRIAIISQRIKEVAENSQQAARFAQDLGFEQQAAAAFFLQGSDAILKYTRQVKALGLGLSDLDAENIEKAQRAMGIFGDITKATTEQLAARFAPTIAEIINSLSEWIEEAGGIEAAMDKVIDSIVDGFDLLVDAATLVAIVLGGRLAGAAAVNVAAFVKANMEALRYQATLARMAGVSKAAALSMTAMGTAARGASVAMAALGGPVGIALIAAGAIWQLSRSMSDAKTQTLEQTDSIKGLREQIKSLTETEEDRVRGQIEAAKTMSVLRRQEIAAETQLQQSIIEQTDPSGRGASTRINLAKKRIQELSAELQATDKNYADAVRAGQEYEKHLADLRNKLKDASSATNDNTEQTDKMLESYLKMEAGLREQLALLGLTTDADRLRTRISEGFLEGLTAEQATALIQLQEEIDAKKELIDLEAKRAGAETTRSILGDFDEQVAAQMRYEAMLARIAESTGTVEEKTRLLTLATNQYQEELDSLTDKGYWEQWLEGAEEALTSFDELGKAVVDNFSGQFGSAFESMIFDSKSLGDAFADLSVNMARSVINALGQMAAQWLAYQAVQLVTGKVGQSQAVMALSANAQASAIMAGINAFSSTAAIPIVGPALAPAAMTTALAVTQPMAVAVGAAALAGMAHDGIDSIPQTGTWLLEKGERVTTAETSAKLDRTLDAVMVNSSGGAVTIQQHFEVNGDVSEETLRLMSEYARKAAEEGAKGGYRMVVDDFNRNGPARRMVV